MPHLLQVYYKKLTNDVINSIVLHFFVDIREILILGLFSEYSLSSEISREQLGRLQWYIYHSLAFLKLFHIRATCIFSVVAL